MPLTAAPKFQHTRALLANIARDNEGARPDILVTPLDGDDDGDGSQSVSSSVVAQVSSLLQDEREDELKAILRDSFGVPDDEDVVSPDCTPMLPSSRCLVQA